jgi:glycosyltransferase involved in cell wall biosynthesis
MRVLHIITDLDSGGAEMQLCGLCALLKSAGYDQKVVVLKAEGLLSPRIRALGIDCIHLNLRAGRFDLGGVRALRPIMQEYRPAVIHAWMYHACVYAALAGASGRPLLLSVHHSSLSFANDSVSTLMAAFACGVLSYRRNVHLAYCAESARRSHEGRGYCRERGVFIPNGYASSHFQRNGQSGEAMRARLGIPAGAFVLGLVARFNPIKDHTVFLKAFSLVRERHPEAVAILAGNDIDSSNVGLLRLISRWCPDHSAVVLAGRCSDMVAAYSAMDVLILSSRSEAFPNVLCEGMLCELPCVTTDVGDCRSIVGDCGTVVAPRSADLLGAAMLRMLELPYADRVAMGLSGRRRIAARYPEDEVLRSYAACYENCRMGLRTAEDSHLRSDQ